MKKSYIILILIVLAAGVITITSTSEVPEEITQEEPIKIGFVIPASGTAAVFGEFARNGLAIALEQTPPELRDRVEIIEADSKCSPKDGVSAVRKLIDVDKVNYIIGPLCNNAAIPTEKLIEEGGVLALLIGAPTEEAANFGDNHFSFSPEIEKLMKRVAKDMWDKGIRRVASIGVSDFFLDENFRGFNKHFSTLGGEIVFDERPAPDTSDFRGSALELKASDPDAIIVFAYTKTFNLILTALHEIGLSEKPRYGIHTTQSPETLQIADISEGFIYPYPISDVSVPSAERFTELYTSKYEPSVNPYAPNVFDSYNLLLPATETCGYENITCVQKELTNIKDYPSASGLLTIDERGVGNIANIALKTIRNGEFVMLED